MKALKFLISLASIFAAGMLFAQTAPVQQAATATAAAPASDGIKIAVRNVDNNSVIVVEGDAKKLASSTADALEELFRRAVTAANLNSTMHQAALDSALTAVKAQLKTPNNPVEGPFKAEFRLTPTITQPNVPSVNLNGNISMNGASVAINTKTEPKAEGGVTTVGNIIRTDPQGVVAPANPIVLAIDPAGNVTGSVGAQGVAAKTPEAVVAEVITTPTTKQDSVTNSVTPDNTITTTLNR